MRYATRTMLALVSAVLLLAAGLAAQKPESAQALLRAATDKAVVDGDLNGAIKQFQAIVDTFKTDRAVVATALVHMAECYQKLGDAESRKIYERVVRDYADQREAVSVARARLDRNESAPRAGAMSSRQVWTLPNSGTIANITVSHDGRYLPYTDWAVPGGNGELFLHDIAGGADRRITNDVEKFGQEFVEEATFSPDDTQLAYALFNKDHYELRIIGLQAPRASHPRVLFSNSEVPRIFPGDWSADGKWLAVQLQRKDKTTQIGLVAVKDGSQRVLKSVDWRGASKLFFSPDSKYLAYDLPTDAGNRRDVFVLAIDGSREMPAVVHPSNDVLMGWSPDGSRLLFTSDRTGSTGLWALAFIGGTPQGTPEQIKVDVTGNSMGLTRKGTLYTLVHHSSFAQFHSDIQVAEFDFTSGQFLSTPVLAVQTFVGGNSFPAWSPDGKDLAFLSRRGREDTVIGILSHATGQLRELQPQLKIYVAGSALRWSPDGLSLAIQATDSKGRQGIFRIDATTGAATPIALSSRGPVGEGASFIGPAWAPDGKRIYYNRIKRFGEGAFTAIVERDLSSGNEKELIRRSGRADSWDLSPDGKYWVVVDGDVFAGPPTLPGRTGTWNVLLIPASGGEPKELMRGESRGGGVLMWAPDSRSIFVYSVKDESTGDREVWRVAIDGTAPQKLDPNVNVLGRHSAQHFHAHPDGKRVAFAATERAKPDEVWALENFLPAVNAKK